jgi:glycosyltransferase involved in cell wall biosynthesis
VAVVGQSFEETRVAFESAGAALGERLVHIGEPGSRADYATLLASADVAVSTARNEFFGLAMLEAAYAGCLPLVLDRLAYPEIYPARMRYVDNDTLVARLRDAVLHHPESGQGRAIAEAFTAASLGPQWRAAFRDAACSRGPSEEGA